MYESPTQKLGVSDYCKCRALAGFISKFVYEITGYFWYI